jgi:hypothetical protein
MRGKKIQKTPKGGRPRKEAKEVHSASDHEDKHEETP